MRIYSATDVGQKRKMNQDYVFASEGPVGNLPNLFTVADGMGGHNAGDYASSHAVRILVDEIREMRIAILKGLFVMRSKLRTRRSETVRRKTKTSGVWEPLWWWRLLSISMPM